MSEISIQVRRVTERVKSYFSLFGFTHFSRIRPGRAVIKGKRRLGADEIECVVSETARGTSVGFYIINTLQGLLYTIPFLVLILLHLLNNLKSVEPYLTGSKTLFNLNLLKLFTGVSDITIKFVLILIVVASIPFLIEIYVQKVRLNNLKSRFSFYTRDAVWETRELSPSIAALRSVKSTIAHGYFLAMIYFAVFATQDGTLEEVTDLYRTDSAQLLDGTINAFTITVGSIIGLLAADKSIILRKDNARIDRRNRISGGLLERRIEPVIFGIQSACYSSIVFVMLMSVTFLSTASFNQAIQLISFAILGGIIAGIIHQEGSLWIASSYAILIFFTSLILIFQTGSRPEYAFILILQLFLLPIPFILYISLSFKSILRKNNISSNEWLYDILPMTAFYSVLSANRRKRQIRRDYDEELTEDFPSEIAGKIKINKEFLQVKDSNAYKLAKHYFELLMNYTASFEDDVFILIPTHYQLENWWCEKSNQSSSDVSYNMLEYVDQMLWDPTFVPDEVQLSKYENIGKSMVLAIR